MTERLSPERERDALAQLAYECNEREKVKEAEIDHLRAEVERLRAISEDAYAYIDVLETDAERLAEALRREAEQSADGGIPESLAALTAHDEERRK